jgi:putative transposase
VDFVRRWSEKTEIGAGQFIRWLGITASKFYGWRERYGKVNEHNGWVPRDFWLEEWEKREIIAFHLNNPLEGYRRLTFMMLDANIVAVSPATVWRVRTAKSNAGTNHSKGSASAPERRCRWKMRAIWLRATWSITTTCV